MSTTIQVSDSTLQLLKGLKEDALASSYDAIIFELAKRRSRTPKSMFNSIKGLKWRKSDRMEFHEL